MATVAAAIKLSQRRPMARSRASNRSWGASPGPLRIYGGRDGELFRDLPKGNGL